MWSSCVLVHIEVPIPLPVFSRTSKLFRRRMLSKRPQMELVFLGTCSMVPTLSRNVSSIALRLDNEYWIFDCGEGTQLQLQKGKVNPSLITRIFVTHLHGDHVFGLPGMLIQVGNAGKVRVIQIVGPRGLRNYIRTNLTITTSGFMSKYCVDEVWETEKELSSDHEKDDKLHCCEVPGRNIVMLRNAISGHGYWKIPRVDKNNSNFKEIQIMAASLKHSIFCLGFVIQESPYPGKIKMTPSLQERLQSTANRVFLLKKGIVNPLSLLQTLKTGKPVELVDGTLRPEKITGNSRLGRKITILGDTCDSRAIAEMAFRSDVLIHECTNAHIPELDKSSTVEEVEARSYIHGHSTPRTAGEFANALQCKQLILTHFSRRYSGDTVTARNILQQIVHQAKQFAPKCFVQCAHDLERISIPITDESIEHAGTADEVERAYASVSHLADMTKTNVRDFFSKHTPRSVDRRGVAALGIDF